MGMRCLVLFAALSSSWALSLNRCALPTCTPTRSPHPVLKDLPSLLDTEPLSGEEIEALFDNIDSDKTVVPTNNMVGRVVPTSSLEEEEEQEYKPITMESLQTNQPANIALGLVIGYVTFGVLFYYEVTDWNLLESFYFVIVTLTSVGFGDLTPAGDGVRLFTAAYILFGVGILGTALGEVVSSLLNVDATPAGRLLKWLSGAAGEKRDGKEGDGEQGSADNQIDQVEALGGGDATAALVSTLGTVAACLAFGSAAFMYLEPGLNFVDALYYAVVTATTVGYGDYYAQSPLEQGFVAGYALFGTILLARSLGALAALPLERRRQYQQALVLDQYGGELDADELQDLQTTLVDLELCDPERGYCTRSDFALAMLVRQDKVSRDDVQIVLGTFQKLDIDGSGELDEEDVQAWIEKQQADEK